MKIEAILFDVIGTTVLENDPNLINNCFKNAFSNNAVVISEQDINRVRGKDKLHAIDEILLLTGNPSDLRQPIFNDFKKNVTAEISNFQEHPQLSDLISFLRSRNIKVGVGSGLPLSVFEILFDHLHWQNYKFDYAAVFETLKVGRPDPAMVVQMSKQLAILPARLLKVGDTIADIMEGKNALAPTAAVLSGTQASELLRQCQPDYILNSLAEITSIIDKQP